MPMTLRLSVTTALVLGLAGCSATPAPTAEAEIRGVLSAQVDAWNRGDLEGFMAGYWHSDDLTFQSGETVTKGWQPTLDRYRKKYKGEGAEMGHLTFDGIQVDVQAADTARVRGRWELTRRKDTPHGAFTLEMKRFDDGWKIVADRTTAEEK